MFLTALFALTSHNLSYSVRYRLHDYFHFCCIPLMRTVLKSCLSLLMFLPQRCRTVQKCVVNTIKIMHFIIVTLYNFRTWSGIAHCPKKGGTSANTLLEEQAPSQPFADIRLRWTEMEMEWWEERRNRNMNEREREQCLYIQYVMWLFIRYREKRKEVEGDKCVDNNIMNYKNNLKRCASVHIVKQQTATFQTKGSWVCTPVPYTSHTNMLHTYWRL